MYQVADSMGSVEHILGTAGLLYLLFNADKAFAATIKVSTNTVNYFTPAFVMTK
jgi:hypothetical protein